MTWRNSPLLRKRSEITELIDSLLADDIDAIAGLLAKFPSLAHEPLTLGATRQESVDYFIDEIGHYIYSGDTALHIAAMTYCVDAVAMLCEHGADVAARNRRGAQPLHYACDGSPNAPTWNPTRQGATVARLIDLGADPNALDKSGVAPIHRAVRQRCTGALKALIAGGANVNLRNKSGTAPIRLAQLTTGRGGSGTAETKREQEAVIQLLLAAGAREES